MTTVNRTKLWYLRMHCADVVGYDRGITFRLKFDLNARVLFTQIVGFFVFFWNMFGCIHVVRGTSNPGTRYSFY